MNVPIEEILAAVLAERLAGSTYITYDELGVDRSHLVIAIDQINEGVHLQIMNVSEVEIEGEE